MQTPSVLGVMARLKLITAPRHDELEAQPTMRRLVDPELTLPVYQDLLRRFHRATAICEHHLLLRTGVWEAQGFDWASRLIKTAWLEADLLHLDPAFNLTTSCLDVSLVPYAGEGFARAAGCLYVLEGATLGSRQIVKFLNRAHRQPAAGANRYFQGYGNETSERWSTLCRELEASLGHDEETLEQAMGAAGETYRFFGRILADK